MCVQKATVPTPGRVLEVLIGRGSQKQQLNLERAVLKNWRFPEEFGRGIGTYGFFFSGINKVIDFYFYFI